MTLSKFLYYILKEDGRSAKVVNKVVTYTGVPTPLPQTPDGWQELLLLFERSLERHSIETGDSLNLGFVRDGAHIIRHAMYNNSTNEKIFLLIQRLTLVYDGLTYNWLYKYLHKGQFNLIKASDTDDIVSVPIIEGGLRQLIESKYDKLFEIPFTDEKAVLVYQDGLEIENSIAGIIENGESNDGAFFFKNHLLELRLITAETGFIGAANEVSRVQVDNSNTAIRATEGFFLKSTGDGEVEIEWNFDFSLEYTPTSPGVNPAAVYKIVVRRINEANFSDTQVELFSRASGLGFTGNFNASGTSTIIVRPKDELYLYAFCNIEGATGDTQIRTLYQVTDDSLFKIKFNYRHPSSYAVGFRRIDIFRYLMFQIAGNKDLAVSTLLENDYDVITGGDGIRRIEGGKLYTSFKDLFEDTDATFMAGMQIFPDRVEIEERQKYYEEQDEVNLGIVKEFKKIPAENLMCDSFSFGHIKQDIEDLNGRYDPNGTNKFIGPLTNVSKDYNGVSPYKAGPYEIEFIRINLDGKTTTDNNTDKQPYVLAAVGEPSTQSIVLSFSSAGNYIVFPASPKVAKGTKFRIIGSVNNDRIYEVTESDPIVISQTVYTDQVITVAEFTVNVTIEFITNQVYLLDRPAFDTLEGVLNNTIFNITRLTPSSMKNRHKRWIKSMHYGLEAMKLKFLNGEENKNTDLKTVLGSLTVDEDADETISGFGDFMFYPWYFIFKTETPINLSELIEENPNRTYRFTDVDGNEWVGFLIMAGIAPNDFTPQEFRLLACPSNDIKKLIHG